MIVVGMTGGIGCGKSTTAHLFAALGVPIIDADIIARNIVCPSMPAYRAIVDHFGETILDTKKQIDRKKLQQLIFLNTQEKNWLENLLHPLIQKEMEQQTQALSASYCIWVVPLLLEKNIKVDRILVIDVPEEMQITRTQERDQLSLAQIHAILQTQMIRDKRLQRADDIIYNNGTLLELNEQIQQLHKQYLHLAAQT